MCRLPTLPGVFVYTICQHEFSHAVLFQLLSATRRARARHAIFKSPDLILGGFCPAAPRLFLRLSHPAPRLYEFHTSTRTISASSLPPTLPPDPRPLPVGVPVGGAIILTRINDPANECTHIDRSIFDFQLSISRSEAQQQKKKPPLQCGRLSSKLLCLLVKL